MNGLYHAIDSLPCDQTTESRKQATGKPFAPFAGSNDGVEFSFQCLFCWHFHVHGHKLFLCAELLLSRQARRF
ncbi:Uncharacterised protein [Vibrio cholerae]|nr:Uncharacterised protein [Vibrio cholerae]CSB62059.1 Uncharacterised protein [Vibrio cholerae]CSC98939.1 Uncharacterised protein [Vibrio cholerae]CSI49077.1 Uncharacterised protein [Vibrio cholerae]